MNIYIDKQYDTDNTIKTILQKILKDKKFTIDNRFDKNKKYDLLIFLFMKKFDFNYWNRTKGFINHLPNYKTIYYKDFMLNLFNFEDYFDFLPITFIYDKQINNENSIKNYISLYDFIGNHIKYSSMGKNIWIIKPSGLSRGRGIKCFDNLDNIINYVIVSDKKISWLA